jgi:uncharacterized membrane protein
MNSQITSSLILYYIIGILCVLIFTALAFKIANLKRINISQNILYVLIICSGYMFFVQLFKFYSLHYYTDFAHWGQVIASIANTGKPLSIGMELYRTGSLNYFSMHFTPLVYLFGLFYKIMPYAETIIFFNNVFMISAIIPLYKLCDKKYKDKSFALFVCVLLLWYPSFQYIVTYEFEMLRFSIPIIFWMIYFFETKKVKAYYLFVILAILVREEVGLTIMMFGLYVFFFKKQRITGAITCIVGLIGFFVIISLIMPSLSSAGYNNNIAMDKLYGSFGKTTGEIIKNIILNPLLTISVIFQKIKIANVFMMFMPLIFISFFAPSALLGSVAQFGVGLLSSYNTNTSYMLYYVSPTIPFIFYAFIKGWPKLLQKLEIITNRKINTRQLNSSAMTAVLTGLLVSNVFFSASPLSLQFWFKNIRPAPFKTQNHHYTSFLINNHHRNVKDFIDFIPDTAIVAAHMHLQSQLVNKRGTIFLNEHSENPNYLADYIFFDKTNNNIKPESPAFKTQELWDIFEKDIKNWVLVKFGDGYFLYKRKS